MRSKMTNIKRTTALDTQVNEKLILPLQKLFGKEQSAVMVDIELAQITTHHQTGKIWKCEITITSPGTAYPLRVEMTEKTLNEAIDKAKDRVERKVKQLADKKRTRVRSGARILRRSEYKA